MPACPSCGQENPEDARFCNACGAPLEAAPAAREQRKTVTVLFCDVTGSTALGESTDPEALRALLARYFERMKGIVESHGGTVEKFIGDAVMAVFGVPQVHEDDALRACRAAVEMRDALPELGVAGADRRQHRRGRHRHGGAPRDRRRRQRRRPPGAGRAAGRDPARRRRRSRSSRDAVEAEPVEPLELKGKAEPVAALPARRGARGARAPARGAASSGASASSRCFARPGERAGDERRCELVTVVGDAGVGKSRLVAEFARRRSTRAVVRGRCLSYGEGITYWPVVEVVKQLDALPSDRGRGGRDPLAARGDATRPRRPEEIAWAFRKLLEEQAPLVVRLRRHPVGRGDVPRPVEHVALLSRGAPILLLCMARPELLERRPGSGRSRSGSSRLPSDETSTR